MNAGRCDLGPPPGQGSLHNCASAYFLFFQMTGNFFPSFLLHIPGCPIKRARLYRKNLSHFTDSYASWLQAYNECVILVKLWYQIIRGRDARQRLLHIFPEPNKAFKLKNSKTKSKKKKIRYSTAAANLATRHAYCYQPQCRGSHSHPHRPPLPQGFLLLLLHLRRRIHPRILSLLVS